MRSAILALALTTADAFLAPRAAAPPATVVAARQPIMAGNWKLNPGTVQEADALAKGVAAAMGDETCAISEDAMCTEVVVFPPFPFIASVVDDLENVGVGVGAQSIFHQAETGAYRGRRRKLRRGPF